MPNHMMKRVWCPGDWRVHCNWVFDFDTIVSGLPTGWTLVERRDKAYWDAAGVVFPRGECCPIAWSGTFGTGDFTWWTNTGIPCRSGLASHDPRLSGDVANMFIHIRKNTNATLSLDEQAYVYAFSVIDYDAFGVATAFRQLMIVQEIYDSDSDGIADRLRHHTMTMMDESYTFDDPTCWFPCMKRCQWDFDPDTTTGDIIWSDRTWPYASGLLTGYTLNKKFPEVWSTYFPAVLKYIFSVWSAGTAITRGTPMTNQYADHFDCS